MLNRQKGGYESVPYPSKCWVKTDYNQNETNRKVKIMKELLNSGQVLDRSEMKKIMAGSGSDGGGGGGGGGDCPIPPCWYPQYTSCCCTDGRRTCVENSSNGYLQCWSWCGIGG